MFRLGMNQTAFSVAAQMNNATLGRKLKGIGEWTFDEVVRIADLADVTVQEMLDGLPSLSEWEARRDSVRHQGLEPRTRCLGASASGVTCPACDGCADCLGTGSIDFGNLTRTDFGLVA